MRDEKLIEQLREAVRRRSQRPPLELWHELVRRGIIDEEGNVLVRMPEPPEHLRTDQKTKQKKKRSSASKKGKGASPSATGEPASPHEDGPQAR